MNSYTKRINSDISIMKDTVNEILDFISLCIPNLPYNEYHDMKLIYSEAKVNAIIHGNENDKDKFVNININLDKNTNTIDSYISDQGRGFNFNELKTPDTLSESGRGVFLIKNLCDYSYYNDNNEFFISKKVTK